MKELNIGQRVSVTLEDGDIYRGVVHRIMPYGNLMLKTDDAPIMFPVVHPKQCRRLIARKRRRVWIHVLDSSGVVPTHALIKYEPDDERIEFVEVRKVKP